MARTHCVVINIASKPEGQVTERILPIAEVVKIVGLSRRSVYRELKAGLFPRPVQLSARRVGWKESAVQAWVEARSAA
jgi:prophage regulatory protein